MPNLARVAERDMEGLRQATRSLIVSYLHDELTSSEAKKLKALVDSFMEQGLTTGDLRSVVAGLTREGGDEQRRRRLLEISKALTQI